MDFGSMPGIGIYELHICARYGKVLQNFRKKGLQRSSANEMKVKTPYNTIKTY